MPNFKIAFTQAIILAAIFSSNGYCAQKIDSKTILILSLAQETIKHYNVWFPKEEPLKWVGITKELNEKGEEVLSSETLVSSDSKFTKGEIYSYNAMTSAPSRNWSFTGTLNTKRRIENKDIPEVLIIQTTHLDNARKDMKASIVLKGTTDQGTLKGFWVGYDVENENLMTCPYMLIDSSILLTKHDYDKNIDKSFMEQHCQPL